MQHFRATTNGKIVVMGRKTFDSIGRPLPNRTNIVITNSKNLTIDGVKVYTDYKKVLADYKDSDIFVIGGKSIYELFLPYATDLIISKINNSYKCDTFIKMDLSSFKLEQTDKRDSFIIEHYRRYE
jgi:dihydrofolate reductase